MAIAFNKQKGSARKTNLESVRFTDGDNRIRIVGDILARYVYWVKGEKEKNIPMECLSFNRDEERFDNVQKDWVREFYPDLKCGWSYATQAIVDGKLLVVNLKKKLWEQIITAAEDLGDPTDIETGWDLCFRRVKTGPLPFNVEYQLQALKCKPRPLTDEEREAIRDMKSMDMVIPRPTPETQKEFLDRIRDSEAKNVDDTIDEDFDIS